LGIEREALETVNFGGFSATQEDFVFADDDRVVFAPTRNIEKVLSAAQSISRVERQQADAIRSGKKLREQLQFNEYLTRRSEDPGYTFRRHLREGWRSYRGVKSRV